MTRSIPGDVQSFRDVMDAANPRLELTFDRDAAA